MATLAQDVTAPADPFDVSRPELYRDDTWHEPFRRLRAKAPVHKVVDSDFGPYWSVSTYKPIVEVESLPDLYSSEANGFTISRIAEDEVRMPMFIGRDRPIHTAQRRTVAPAFTPSEMVRLTQNIRDRSAEVLDTLPWNTAFDWVERVSIELTTQMLAILFDFPWEDRAKLTMWSDWMGDIELAKSEELRQQRLEKIYECGAYFQKLWAAKAGAAPTPDLISMMIHSDAMSHMDANEFMGNLILLIVGGNDTTRNTMSGLVYALDQFPAERAKLEADSTLIPNAVSEIIRWQTPLAHMARTAQQDTELMGQRIAAGDKVVMWYAAANRDPEVFDEPFRFDVTRSDNPHFAFGGGGPHFCLGAFLAKMEIQVLLEEMVGRGIRLEQRAEPVRLASNFVHGVESLQLGVMA